MKAKLKQSHRSILCLSITLLAVMFISFFLGRLDITPEQLLGILSAPLTGAVPFWTAQQASIVLYSRLPRILLAVMVGACLSTAGASYQGIFQNPMAAPDILGASAGAAFGASLAIINGWNGALIMLSAFFFSMVTVLVVYIISRMAKGDQTLGLVLSGIMISSLFSAGTSFIKLVADTQTQLPAITYWLMGSLNGSTMADVRFAAFPMLLGMIPLFLIRWRINVLSIGDTEALTMGVDVRMVRFIVIVCSTLMTAASVAVSGMIGWVGLVIPHLSRRLVGNDYRSLIPATMLLGGCFLLVVDDISRNLLSTELPLGILNAVIGVPFFIYLLLRREGLQ
ncbi:FecCD family ABC transporter permease [Eubacterium sp.]|uniref:FecCD family ABC transporter permease n=1 Tax=Eubacterium sp. TaxID=142586 RepID=UPI003FA614D2